MALCFLAKLAFSARSGRRKLNVEILTEMIKILFYETDKAYGCFSNFSRHAVSIDGITWPTSEHYFQAQKFSEQADVSAVHEAVTPFLAAQIGRERQRSFRADWNDVRDSIMLSALRAKFKQHAELREVLVSTQGTTLVEHTKNDRYWGDGGDGTGKNTLGILLQQVRAELSDTGSSFVAPPWVDAPDIEVSDMYWRMGKGEEICMNAARFRDGLGSIARQHYELYFPVPADWRGSW